MARSLHPAHGRRPHQRPLLSIHFASALAAALALCLRRIAAAPVVGAMRPASSFVIGRCKPHRSAASVAFLKVASMRMRAIFARSRRSRVRVRMDATMTFRARARVALPLRRKYRLRRRMIMLELTLVDVSLLGMNPTANHPVLLHI